MAIFKDFRVPRSSYSRNCYYGFQPYHFRTPSSMHCIQRLLPTLGTCLRFI